jgi:hypothetical protein
MPRNPRLWRDLSKATKDRYRRSGVTPSAYNAWQRKTPEQRRAIRLAFPDTSSGPAAVSARGRQRRENRTSALRERAAENMIRVLFPATSTGQLKHRPNEDKIRERVGVMDRDELLVASVADLDTIRDLASNQVGWRPMDGQTINPFWYG